MISILYITFSMDIVLQPKLFCLKATCHILTVSLNASSSIIASLFCIYSTTMAGPTHALIIFVGPISLVLRTTHVYIKMLGQRQKV